MQENQILWDVTKLLLMGVTYSFDIDKHIESYYNHSLQTYNQSHLNGSTSDYMSHDQMTAFLVFGQMSKNPLIASRFYDAIKKQGFVFYDNLNTENGWSKIAKSLIRFDIKGLKNIMFLHPRDLIFVAQCAGKKWVKWLTWLDWIITIQGFIYTWKIRGDKKFLETDTKILQFIKWQVIRPNKALEYISMKCLKHFSPAFDNLYDCIHYYHRKGSRLHPILCREKLSTKYLKFLLLKGC